MEKITKETLEQAETFRKSLLALKNTYENFACNNTNALLDNEKLEDNHKLAIKYIKSIHKEKCIQQAYASLIEVIQLIKEVDEYDNKLLKNIQ